VKPHIGNEVNLLSSYLLVQGNDVKYIYEIHIALASRRSRVRIPLKPWYFQASSFRLLKLENLLRWSLFTFIYNRSTNMHFKHIFHVWWYHQQFLMFEPEAQSITAGR